MNDMLVKLYELPDLNPALRAVADLGIEIRRPLPYEKRALAQWVENHFSANWSQECAMAFHFLPVRCFMAVRDRTVLGFACHDCTCRNFFGPIGVLDAITSQGVGTALLLMTLHAMRSNGYAYAVIGAAGVPAFFEKTVNARKIEGSSPGIYKKIIEKT